MNNLSNWVSVADASKLLGISETTLWKLKNTKTLVAGVHWLYVTGQKNSNVKWNVEAINKWQVEQTIETENAPLEAAKNIASYSELGVS
tara:strand:- start:16 stop:282 length:267 start_codon:yes stop_codon:yes gene_type:complete